MKTFLAQFKTWTHVAAGVIVTLVGLYVSNDAVHKAVNGMVSPKAAAIIAGVASIVLAYANSKNGQ